MSGLNWRFLNFPSRRHADCRRRRWIIKCLFHAALCTTYGVCSGLNDNFCPNFIGSDAVSHNFGWGSKVGGAGLKRAMFRDAESNLSPEDNLDVADRKRKKVRTTFTGRQIFELEKMFETKKYLSSSERSEMSKLLNVTEQQVSLVFLSFLMNFLSMWEQWLAHYPKICTKLLKPFCTLQRKIYAAGV